MPVAAVVVHDSASELHVRCTEFRALTRDYAGRKWEEPRYKWEEVRRTSDEPGRVSCPAKSSARMKASIGDSVGAIGGASVGSTRCRPSVTIPLRPS